MSMQKQKELIDQYVTKEKQTLQKMLEKSRMNIALKFESKTHKKIKGIIELKFLLYINSKINQFQKCKKDIYVPPSSRVIAKILNCCHTWILKLFKKYNSLFVKTENKKIWKWKWSKNQGIKISDYFLKSSNKILDFEKLKPLGIWILEKFKYSKYQKQWFDDLEDNEFSSWVFNDWS